MPALCVWSVFNRFPVIKHGLTYMLFVQIGFVSSGVRLADFLFVFVR